MEIGVQKLSLWTRFLDSGLHQNDEMLADGPLAGQQDGQIWRRAQGEQPFAVGINNLTGRTSYEI
ncbi:MAG: hypothetical protein BZY68_02560 [SAR202 cluster bacterium MP-SAtl-SRR3965592-G2]|nr:MAG: hypothetical protein COB68_03380 [SAR202 cluster bacterium]PKB74811.1 MAG: hypothetical protein BZY68_02560 [SAR202 cluster bacterium MP-SAtl-SRR3965592-G2]